MKGHPTTRGYVVNKDDVQHHDDTIVATLRAAGAVFFCRTTMPQTGMALETVSNLWGRTLNPFYTKLVAGGSSGGDGAGGHERLSNCTVDRYRWFHSCSCCFQWSLCHPAHLASNSQSGMGRIEDRSDLNSRFDWSCLSLS